MSDWNRCNNVRWPCCYNFLEIVNTQAWTHAQIHIHAQIPAYVQLPTLFQPRVLLQPSAHLHHNQAPGPAKIPVDPPVLAETLILTCRPHITSVDRNEVATFYPFGPAHPGNRKLAILEGLFPITSFHFICYPFFSPIPISTPLTLTIPVCLTLGHIILLVQTIIHPWSL